MKLSTNTHALQDALGLKETVRLLAQAGFDGIDLYADGGRILSDDCGREFCGGLRRYAEDMGMCFTQAHAPFPSSFCDEAETQARYDAIVRAMRRAAWLGAENIVVHPCKHLDYEAADGPERLFDINMAFFRSLIPVCEETGIHIAIENLGRFENGVRHSPCSRPEEFVRYLDALDSEWIRGCIDLGHAQLVGVAPDAMIRALGSRLSCLHVQDILKDADSHTLPYYGILDWDAVLRALAETGYRGDMTFEASNFYARLPQPLWADALRFMAATGRFLIRRFEAFAE